MTFEPNLTQRIVRKAKGRIAKDWRSRLRDYSSILAQVGVLAQGGLLLLPAGAVPADTAGYVAAFFFVLIGVAKIITEPGASK